MGRDEKEAGKGAELCPLPRDVGILLAEIEKEPVPDRLLELARELQQALAETRKATVKG